MFTQLRPSLAKSSKTQVYNLRKQFVLQYQLIADVNDGNIIVQQSFQRRLSTAECLRQNINEPKADFEKIYNVTKKYFECKFFFILCSYNTYNIEYSIEMLVYK